MKGNNPTPSINSLVLPIAKGNGNKRKVGRKAKWKNKAQSGSSSNGLKARPNSDIPTISDPKMATCYYCNDKGHWKRSRPKYLQDIEDGKGLKESEEVEHGRMNLIMGNRQSSLVTKIRTYQLVLN
ncbi:uncharacterized protein LOC111881988 [Lactuca sativa]|uniref:uncharacterized protein LOC111881988 n=1 Tax=Lactuca sativa TaxID=4236 RepID=UPI000CD93DB6|nr:uncharacterized protein LOC111881988 [Lactuca sativa]